MTRTNLMTAGAPSSRRSSRRSCSTRRSSVEVEVRSSRFEGRGPRPGVGASTFEPPAAEPPSHRATSNSRRWLTVEFAPPPPAAAVDREAPFYFTKASALLTCGRAGTSSADEITLREQMKEATSTMALSRRLRLAAGGGLMVLALHQIGGGLAQERQPRVPPGVIPGAPAGSPEQAPDTSKFDYSHPLPRAGAGRHRRLHQHLRRQEPRRLGRRHHASGGPRTAASSARARRRTGSARIRSSSGAASGFATSSSKSTSASTARTAASRCEAASCRPSASGC